MPTNYTDNSLFNFTFYPRILTSKEEQIYNSQEEHDFYNVYVNDDWIGKKVLLAQNEKITDMAHYLDENDFSNFSTAVEGNSYYIKEPDREMAKQMKKQLGVYLNIE